MAAEIKRRVTDKQFVESLVKEPIIEFSHSSGSNTGDNVMAEIVSLKVKTVSGLIHNIAYKSIPVTNPMRTIAIKSESFLIESLFYKEIVPAIDKLTNSSLPVPKFYGFLKNDYSDFIAMEDLRPQGYKMANKYVGLNIAEVSIVMQEIAKFHAKSFYFIRHKGEGFFEGEEMSVFLKYGLACRTEPKDGAYHFNKFYQQACNIMKIKRNSKLAQKMETLSGKSFEIQKHPWTETDNKYFPVIVHGDLWVNNIFFKYDSSGDTPVDVKFIDFQQTRRSSIYDDLMYFMYNSTTTEFRKQFLPNVLETYYQSFTNELDTLRCPLPTNFTRGTFIDGFYENMLSGFAYAVFAIPFQFGELPENEALDSKNQDSTNESEDYEGESPFEKWTDALNVLLKLFPQLLENSDSALDRMEAIVQEMVDTKIL